MIDNPTALTKALTTQVKRFETDLHERLNGPLTGVKQQWTDEHKEAVRRERTGQSWSEFSTSRITQAAVAWVLTSVFVRFCEDNRLLKPVWFSGPGPRAEEAVDRQDAFIRKEAATNPDVTVRDWIHDVVAYLGRTPATAALVDSYSPMYLITPSADACRELIGFWRATDAAGGKEWDFTDPELSTRFLGDLYQDLSESAKKKYALLQTPEFVEEFILDRTLTPALRETKATAIRLIDPTCGSGHFLLGAFQRILDELYKEHPSMTTTGRVQLALDAVRGVDLNPFAVAITRFRLMVVAMKEAGNQNLDRDSSNFDIRVAVGDSLLHGEIDGPIALANDDASLEVSGEHEEFVYADENQEALKEILRIGYYDVVVGNPPYITVKDKTLNKRYRAIYDTCHMKYAISVPFMERFFELAKRSERAGYVGQITSNSFMKREFGVKLIEQYLAKKVDLGEVIDTSGAYIPGHGTPTVIITGRNRPPGQASVRAVLGIQGEPGKPKDPAKALVWSSIARHVTDPGYQDQWVSVTDLERKQLAVHPWSLSGGAAVNLNAAISYANTVPLELMLDSVGILAVTGMDEAYVGSPRAPHAWRETLPLQRFVEGTSVRDYDFSNSVYCLFPKPTHTSQVKQTESIQLWPQRAGLRARQYFSKTNEQRSMGWQDYVYVQQKFVDARLLISFAFVATHNHFVLDRGGKVFNRSAPVIKLPAEATVEQHLELIGVLNSSVACFWLKQNSHNKGGGGIGGGIAEEHWEQFYEFTGTTLKDFPLPSRRPVDIAGELDRLAQDLAGFSPTAALDADGYATRREALEAYSKQADSVRDRMIALQEELDWQVYQSYRLTDIELTYDGEVPDISLGERAFEIAMGRKLAADEGSAEWFIRHGSTPITDVPSHWPENYRALIEQRLALIESDKNINLLERPEYKRRWAGAIWQEREADAIREWLCDKLESRDYWFEGETPSTRTIANLADLVARDADFMEVLALFADMPEPDVVKALTALLAPEAVPYLAAYRYKETGLLKRGDWEHTWKLQRHEDAGTYRPRLAGEDGPIPVPPKYTKADFAKAHYWTNRGKLDVPKERFVLYPHTARGLDATPRLGWAGWDHAQQALALANLIEDAKADGESDERLIPLAAGLEELEPWLKQWHGDFHPEYGEAPAVLFSAILDELTVELNQTRSQLHDWRPALPAKRARRTPTKA